MCAHREDGERPRESPAPTAFFDASALRIEGPLTVSSLSRIRQTIAAQAAAWHVEEPIVDAIQAVSSELAANMIVHAHGDGRLIVTHRLGAVYCQAVDRGPGMPLPFLAGWQAPAIGDPAAARGLWMVRMLSTRMQIDSSVMGTTVTVALVWK